MAISPSIPTSFVPKQPLDAPRRKMQGGDNLFLLVALVILAVSVVTAGAVFGYQKYLESAVELKEAALEDARKTINEDRIEDFIRLRQRFESAGALLDGHIASSRFFALLEESTLQNVQFEDLDLQIAEDRTGRVTLSGAARNFNTLAAQSNAIAAEKEFRRAIFSGITLNTDGTVGFTLTAELDHDLMVMVAPEVVAEPEAPVEAPVEEGVVEESLTEVTPEEPVQQPSL